MYLCIDTATEQSGVAIIGSEENNIFLPLARSHTSDDILRKIDQLIKNVDIRLSDLKKIFVIKGPGSFTALRVGISVANQFAHQLGIPIIGIYCDEIYSYRTKEKDYFYLQSMNTDQVYMVGFGKYKIDYPREIVSISECHHELTSPTKAIWLGQLNIIHRGRLEGIPEILDINSPKETWANFTRSNTFVIRKRYELIEPYYGKLPTITKTKKEL
jgi:tRNA threonylcarbamoyl adenosine modification protein YeaZ